jgi:protein-S-isoprenylcysteine O-methyltransferase Ste14
VASWAAIARRIRVPLGFIFAILYFWLAKPSVRWMLLGSVPVIAGLLIRALASGHLRKNEQLARTGPYAYTRNPLYLGSLVLAAGFVMAARSWWIAVAAAVFFVVIYLPVIGSEETFLRQHFPEFEEYARRVPRLLPRLAAAGRGDGSFSWDLYRKHREYNALLGSIVLLAALVAKMVWLY